MSSIDQRIVEMQFDNRQFESGIKTSLQSLTNLKEGLKLEKAAQSLEDLNTTAKRFSLEGIARSVKSVSDAFSAFGVIGITTLVNLTNAATTMGKNIVSSLTIAPISAGYADYNRKLVSVQTIMNATGKDIDTVSGYFKELDTYADKTIYNLDHMTSAFAKFTNAGVDMDKSVPAIKGIANMVALAGQDAGAAQIAMYNLSQSIAGGFLTTMDFKSLNLANVATKEWKDSLIQTAVEAGTVKRSLDGLYHIPGVKDAFTGAQLFTEALSEQWATTDVLLTNLNMYGDETTDVGKRATSAAQDIKSFGMMMETLRASAGTGWTDTFEIIYGNLEEAKALWTPITNYVSDYLNKIADARNSTLQVWKDGKGRDKLITALAEAFKVLKSVIDPISKAFKEIFPPVTGVMLIKWTIGFRDLVEYFKMGEPLAKRIQETFRGLFAVVDIGVMLFKSFVGAMLEVIKFILPVGDGIFATTAYIGNLATSIRDTIKEMNLFDEIFKAIGITLKPLANLIRGVAEGLYTLGADSFKSLEVTPTMEAILLFFGDMVDSFKSLEGIKAEGIVTSIGAVMTAMNPLPSLSVRFAEVGAKFMAAMEKLMPGFKGFVDGLAEAFGKLKVTLVDYFKNYNMGEFFKTLSAGVIIATFIKIVKFVKSLWKTASTMSDLIGSIKGAFEALSGVLKEYQENLKADRLQKIAIAIAILAGSLLVLSFIDAGALGRATLSIVTLFAGLVVAMQSMDTLGASNAKIGKATIGIIGIATAVLILSMAIKAIGGMEGGAFAKGVAGVLVMIAGLTGAVLAINSTDSEADMMKAAVGMYAMASAVNKLAKIVIKLGSIPADQMKQGLMSLAVILGELALFMKFSKLESMDQKVGIGLVFMSIAIQLLAVALEKIGAIPTEQIFQAMLTLAALLVMLQTFVTAMNDVSGFEKTAAGLVVMSVAMAIFAQVIKTLGSLPMETLAFGIGAIAATLLILGAALTFMSDNVAGAQALLITSGALLVLAGVIKLLGATDPTVLAIGLGALAIGLGILVGVLWLLEPLTPVIAALAKSILLFGLAALATGAGIALFAAGLTALLAIGAATAEAVKGAVDKMVLAIMTFIKKMADNAVYMAQSLWTILQALINELLIRTPIVIDNFFIFMNKILKAFKDNVPQFILSGIELVVSIINGITSKIKDIVTAGINLIVGFIDGVTSKIGDVIESAFKLIVSFINGLADAISTNAVALRNAVWKLIKAIVGAVVSFASDIIKSAGEVITTWIDGMKQKISAMWSELVGMGQNLIEGFVQGIKNFAGNLIDAGVGVVRGAVDSVAKFLKMRSPSRLMMQYGEYFDQGFINGIQNLGSDVSAASTGMAKTAVDGVKNAMSRMVDVLEADDEFNPVITPIIDMTNIDSGLSGMNSKFNKLRITPEGTLLKASTVSNQNRSISEFERANTKAAPSLVFTQNNYSPKALSRLDIYRQTKNQFSALKGLVEST